MIDRTAIAETFHINHLRVQLQIGSHVLTASVEAGCTTQGSKQIMDFCANRRTILKDLR